MKSLGLDPRAYLDNNDATAFFAATGDLLLTGPTLTNVNDVRVILVDSDLGFAFPAVRVPENINSLLRTSAGICGRSARLKDAIHHAWSLMGPSLLRGAANCGRGTPKWRI